jgi:hypothetical protein
MIGYKLFEQDMRDGKLYPLFIGKNTETKVGEWLHAEYIPTKGFSTRFGWHVGLVPIAPWLMGLNGKYNSKRGKNFQRVWVEIEYNDSHDYTEEVALLPKKCFEDTEFNGYYHFRETNGHDWVISSDIKVNRVLTEDERIAMLKTMGVDEMSAFKPYYETMKKRKETLDKKKAIK